MATHSGQENKDGRQSSLLLRTGAALTMASGSRLTITLAVLGGGLMLLLVVSSISAKLTELYPILPSSLTQPQEPTTVALTGLPILILLLAAILALPVSIGLLKLYRRAVLTSMHARANQRTVGPVPSETSTSPNRPTQTTSDLPVTDRASSATPGPAEDLHSKLLRAPWRVAAIYAVAGLCYALVMAAATLAAWKIDFLPLRFLVLLWIHAWPVVLTVGLVAAATRRAKVATVAVYFLVLATVGAIATVRGPTIVFGSIAVLWGTTNLPATLLLLAFLSRRVRAVGPLVLTFMVLALMGSALALAIAGSDEGLLRSVAYIGATVGLGGRGTYIGLNLLGFAVFGFVGWLALRWIAVRYDRKKISDQSVTLDSMWILFGVVQSIDLVFGGAAWILSGLVAFAAYKMVSWAGFSLSGRDTAPENTPNLLLLRVFSLGKRSERLFDALAKHWRHIGSIHLIAGPDLAATTIEPHEFLDFLSGKLARRFIDGPDTLNRRILEMDLKPDRDGRFRVNDFFCHEDTWQMTLSRLVYESDAVLMDLRSFSEQNAGVIYEISELIDIVPLERVVFVVDETTDEQFLRQTIQESWNKMSPTSPNRLSTPEHLHLFRLTSLRSGERRHLLAALSNATKSGTVGGGDKLAHV